LDCHVPHPRVCHALLERARVLGEEACRASLDRAVEILCRDPPGALDFSDLTEVAIEAGDPNVALRWAFQAVHEDDHLASRIAMALAEHSYGRTDKALEYLLLQEKLTRDSPALADEHARANFLLADIRRHSTGA
jgi:hypothetical protein